MRLVSPLRCFAPCVRHRRTIIKSMIDNQSPRGEGGYRKERRTYTSPLHPHTHPGSAVVRAGTHVRKHARAAEAFRRQGEKRLVMPVHEPDNLQHLRRSHQLTASARPCASIEALL